MSGIKYLLDTNYLIGLLKSDATVLDDVRQLQLTLSQSGYSAVTRMEILGFAGLTRDEEARVREVLARLVYLPIDRAVEDMAITLRQARKIKLPDAIIAATALCSGLVLLSLDRQLQGVVQAYGMRLQ